MFLDIILPKLTDEACIKIIVLVKSALNLLLSLVKDLMDLKMIKENKFKTTMKAFNPTKVFDFLKSIL